MVDSTVIDRVADAVPETPSENVQPKVDRIPPAIGRRVWYWPSALDIEEGGVISHDRSQPMDVGICYIHSQDLRIPSRISVGGFDHSGEPIGDPDVPLFMPEEITEKMRANGGFAQWMPFQAEDHKRKSLFADYLSASMQSIAKAYLNETDPHAKAG